MPAFVLERASILGSLIAGCCGVLLGAMLNTAPPPRSQPQAADDSLVQWVAPAAEAAEVSMAPEPILLVHDIDGRWVTPDERDALAAETQTTPDLARTDLAPTDLAPTELASTELAAEAPASQAAIDDAPKAADPPATKTAEADEAASPYALAAALPPPLVIGALTP
jgi:hypothetical protein